MGWPSRWGRGDRGRRNGESVVRKVRARNAERVGLFAFPPKEIKALEEVMGLGTETCLEHLAPPADRIPLVVAPLRGRTSDIKMLQEQRSSSQIFFFFFPPGKHLIQTDHLLLQMPVVLINQTRWSQHSPHVTFHQGFV